MALWTPLSRLVPEHTTIKIDLTVPERERVLFAKKAKVCLPVGIERRLADDNDLTRALDGWPVGILKELA
jgi:hypothetical protein